MKKKMLLEIASCLIILLFLYAGMSKLLEFEKFISEINNQPFPNELTPYLAYTIASAEILIALCLMFDKTRLLAFKGALILMSLFTLYTLAILLRMFDRVPCSCGGIINKLTWSQHMVLNSCFTVLAYIGVRLSKRMGNSTAKLNNLKAANLQIIET